MTDEHFKSKSGEQVNIEGAAKVLKYLQKLGGLEYTVKQVERITPDGSRKYIWIVEVRNFNPTVKTTSKAGKEYPVFFKQLGLLARINKCSTNQAVQSEQPTTKSEPKQKQQEVEIPKYDEYGNIRKEYILKNL